MHKGIWRISKDDSFLTIIGTSRNLGPSSKRHRATHLSRIYGSFRIISTVLGYQRRFKDGFLNLRNQIEESLPQVAGSARAVLYRV